MELALRNLVANALRYARHTVTISVLRRRSCFGSWLEDDGEGIPEDDRTAISAPSHASITAATGKRGDSVWALPSSRASRLCIAAVSAQASANLGGAKLVLEWPGPC